MAAILAAVGAGHIGLAEANEAAKLVDAFVRASAVTETAAREERVDALFPGLTSPGSADKCTTPAGAAAGSRTVRIPLPRLWR
jgi:hypothetical protein